MDRCTAHVEWLPAGGGAAAVSRAILRFLGLRPATIRVFAPGLCWGDPYRYCVTAVFSRRGRSVHLSAVLRAPTAGEAHAIHRAIVAAVPSCREARWERLKQGRTRDVSFSPKISR